MSKCTMAIALIAAAGSASSATAGVTVDINATETAYSYRSLNFDEVGGPTGSLSDDAFLASHGIRIYSNDGQTLVDDQSTAFGPWLGVGDNEIWAGFGLRVLFEEHDVTAFSMEWQDASGAPSPFFGGGSEAQVYKDGVQINTGLTFEPAWGGVGDAWVHITSDVPFDEVRILAKGSTGGPGFGDNLSWAPAPGSLALLGMSGLVMRRRRA